MTPLAHRIVKDLTLPVKQRTFKDQCGLLHHMADVHCFDVADVFDMAGDLALDLSQAAQASGAINLMPTQTFLPAERTWVEWRRKDGREGVLLEYDPALRSARAYWAFAGGDMFLSARGNGALILEGGPLPIGGSWPAVRKFEGENNLEARGWVFHIYALLAIINTPRLIGRKQHMPHRGLERALLHAKPLVGKFPLHAWTELTLSVSAMMKQADGAMHEAHLTGERCLHFCRAHLRVRNGQLEQVKAHWRGNPAHGIRRTRYRLAA